MTNAELIKILQKFPTDQQVVVQSYEEGYDPVTDVKELAVAKTENKEWYHGVYDDAASNYETVLLMYSKFNRQEVAGE